MEVSTQQSPGTEEEFLPEDIQNDEDISYRVEQIISDIQSDKASNVPLKLYKWENNQWEQIGQTTADNVPSFHDVGLEHGAGKYKFLFSWKSPRAPRGRCNRVVVFPLNDNYNLLKNQAQQKKIQANPMALLGLNSMMIPQAQNNHHHNNNGGGNEMVMLLIANMQKESQRLHELLLETIRSGKTNQPDKLQEFYLNDISKRSSFVMEQSSFSFREGLKMGQEATQKESESSDMIKIIEVIAENAPAILSTFTSQKKVVDKINSYPGAEQILNDPAKVKTVFNGVAERVGEQKASRIAEKMEIPIPKNNEIPMRLKVV